MRTAMELCYRKMNQQYEFVYESHPDAIFIIDINGQYIYCNPATFHVFGYTREELLEHRIGHAMDDFNRKKAYTSFQAASKGTPQEFDLSIVCKSGETVYSRITLVPAVVDGEVVSVHTFCKDISELVRTQNELKKNQLSLLFAQSIADLGTWTYDVANQTIEWSDIMKEIHGVHSDSDIPSFEEYVEMMHPDDREPSRLRRNSEHVSFEGLGEDLEYRIVRPDGDVRVVMSRVGAISGKNGEPTQFIGAIRDITRRKEREHELKRAQEIAKVGNFSWNFITNEVHFSDQVKRIYNFQSNTTHVDVMHSMIHPDDREEVTQAIYRACSAENVLIDVECRLIIADGTEKHVHFNSSSKFNDIGEPVLLFGIIQDITERKKTEELLRQSDKLHVAGELAAGVAHEIRNPLTTLKGLIQLIQTSDVSDEKRREYREIMLEELERIEFIVSEFLMLAKPETIDMRERDLIVKLNDVIALMSSEALLRNVQMTLNTSIQEVKVKSHVGHLKQVFMNLIKNAIEAIPQGGKIDIAVEPVENKVRITFKDTGCGIPEHLIRKLGEPFYTTKEKGTGLGLMVSNRIIQEHNGQLQIESILGVGTTVSVTLPTS